MTSPFGECSEMKGIGGEEGVEEGWDKKPIVLVRKNKQCLNAEW